MSCFCARARVCVGSLGCVQSPFKALAHLAEHLDALLLLGLELVLEVFAKHSR